MALPPRVRTWIVALHWISVIVHLITGVFGLIINAQRGGDGQKLSFEDVTWLSRDQTPFRKDERERCKRAGARVASMDQLEGLVPMGDDQFGDEDNAGGEEGDGDPPRIWLAEQMTPGCAFTRSIGDAVGEVRATRNYCGAQFGRAIRRAILTAPHSPPPSASACMPSPSCSTRT